MATAWRAFPWDPSAEPAAPFSPRYLPQQSGLGRFDLPRPLGASAWYLAESPEHAVGEKVQDLRNRALRDDFLFERGHRLAICSIELDASLTARLADLCDPSELADRGIAPDRLAFRKRAVTRKIAADLHRDEDLVGFRWWSSFFGEWHTLILFSDRTPLSSLEFSTPEPLRLGSPAVIATAAALAIEIQDG